MPKNILKLNAEDKKVATLALALIKVDICHCEACNTEFAQGVSCSDTDMVPIFLSSAYAPAKSTLVVAQLTHEEYLKGWQESMPKRISRIFDNQAFYCISYKMACPICSALLTVKRNLSLSDYTTANPNTFVVYQSDCLKQRILKL